MEANKKVVSNSILLGLFESVSKSCTIINTIVIFYISTGKREGQRC